MSFILCGYLDYYIRLYKYKNVFIYTITIYTDGMIIDKCLCLPLVVACVLCYWMGMFPVDMNPYGYYVIRYFHFL